jgi:hypothetical protein
MTWLRTWWPELIVWGIALGILGYFVFVMLSALEVV